MLKSTSVQISSSTSYSSVVHTQKFSWMCVLSLAVHHLVWQSDGGAVDKGALFVSSLQKISQQLSFSLNKNGAPPYKAEAIVL